MCALSVLLHISRPKSSLEKGRKKAFWEDVMQTFLGRMPIFCYIFCALTSCCYVWTPEIFKNPHWECFTEKTLMFLHDFSLQKTDANLIYDGKNFEKVVLSNRSSLCGTQWYSSSLPCLLYNLISWFSKDKISLLLLLLLQLLLWKLMRVESKVSLLLKLHHTDCN